MTNLSLPHTVVKRNGALVPFRKERIFKALEAAFRDTKKIPKSEPLPGDVEQSIEEVCALISCHIADSASEGACVTVEGIQDLVEVTLMKRGYHDVAKDYIIYRDQHKALREDSPQNLKIYRKDGALVRFNPMKIASGIEEAFRRVRGIEGSLPETVIEAVNLLTEKVVARAVALAKAGIVLNVALIKDEIEQQLMKEGFFNIAKGYILHRAASGEEMLLQQLDEPEVSTPPETAPPTVTIEEELARRIAFACRGLEEEVSATELLEHTIANFYEGIKEEEIDRATILASRAKIEITPAYSKVAGRLLLDILYRETIGTSA